MAKLNGKPKVKKPTPPPAEALDVADLSPFDFEPEQLFEEWPRHPGVYVRWSVKLADARRDYEERKSRLEVVAAELSRDIRTNPENYGLARTSNDAVAEAVVLQEKYRKAQARVHAARHRMDVVQAFVNGLEHKKRMMESWTQLLVSGVYAAPRLPKEQSREFSERKSGRAFNRRGK